MTSCTRASKRKCALALLASLAALIASGAAQNTLTTVALAKNGFDFTNTNNWGFERAAGEVLSPIDLPPQTAAPEPVFFRFSPSATFSATVAEQQTISLAGDFGSLQTLDDFTSTSPKATTLSAARVEFYMPGSHAFGGKQFDAEVRFLFAAKRGGAPRFAVAVPLRASAAPADPADLLRATFDSARVSNEPIVYQRAHKAVRVSLPAALTKYFAKARTFYIYVGSNTFPKLLRGVTWFVFDQPLQASRDDIEFLRRKYSSDKFNKGNQSPVSSSEGVSLIYASVSSVAPPVAKKAKAKKSKKTKAKKTTKSKAKKSKAKKTTKSKKSKKSK